MKKLQQADAKEKERKLTPAEERRLAAFEDLSAKMEAEGYTRKELTIGIVWANVVALVAFIPVFIGGLALFWLANPGFELDIDLDRYLLNTFIFLVVFFVLVVVHELLHGLTWAIFTPGHWKEIEFGFMVQYFTPYCTCSQPQQKSTYFAGALAPLVLLGIIPSVVGIAAGSIVVTLMGLLMILGAMGDILIVWKIWHYKTSAAEVLYLDHPTQAGTAVFER